MSIEDIKDRLAAATPGPWFAEQPGPDDARVIYFVFHNGDTPDRDWIAEARGDDAEFIAHAPEDIARLVKALEAALGRHEPVMEDGEPVGCYNCDWESGGNEAWPCATVRAITEALDQ